MIKNALETVRRLRAPDGCPWDKKQTLQSLRPYLIEEAYEVLEVLDLLDSPEQLRDPHLREKYLEEWGDVLLQILLSVQIASETVDVTFDEVAEKLSQKLIRRHPHVFAKDQTTDIKTAEDIVVRWKEIKAEENSNQGQEHLLDKVKKGMPPIQRTLATIKEVTAVGFQWPDWKGPLEKLQEEVGEFRSEIEKPNPDSKKIESELGDVLFSVCNLAYLLKIDPETALRGTLRRFESRFNAVEDGIRASGKNLKDSTLEEMDRFWDQAKKNEI